MEVVRYSVFLTPQPSGRCCSSNPNSIVATVVLSVLTAFHSGLKILNNLFAYPSVFSISILLQVICAPTHRLQVLVATPGLATSPAFFCSSSCSKSSHNLCVCWSWCKLSTQRALACLRTHTAAPLPVSIVEISTVQKCSAPWCIYSSGVLWFCFFESWSNPECELSAGYGGDLLYNLPHSSWVRCSLFPHILLLYLITQWLSSISYEFRVGLFFFPLSLLLFPVVSIQCVFSGAGKSESRRY